MTEHGRILVSDGPGERRVAVLDDSDRLRALYVHRTHLAEAGSLHLGRVTGRLPDGSAAFVDIGDPEPAFLNARDARALGSLPPEGAAVLVQVRHAARHGKGARLTTVPLLQGRRLGYRPIRPKGMPAVEWEGDSVRFIKNTVRPWLSQKEGARVRLAALALAPDALAAELDALRARWTAAEAAAKAATPPHRLSPPPDLLTQALDRWPQPEVIEFEGAQVPLAVRKAHPDLADRMEAVSGDLFLTSGVAEQIEEALRPDVPLPCGGTLRIEPTAALVAADVDAGPAAPGRANAEAAAALARHLELRGLAGIVVVDFVPDPDDFRSRRLSKAVDAALAEDPALPQVAGWTRLGLLELTRRRGAPPLADLLCDSAGRLSAETVALEALRRALREAAASPAGRPLLQAAPEVVDALRGPLREALAEAEARLHRPLALEAVAAFARDRVETLMKT